MPTLNNGLASSLWRSRINTWSALFNGGTIGEVLAKDSGTNDAHTWKSALEALVDSGDSESGSWTPSLEGDTDSGATTTYSAQTGNYWRIGPLCWIDAQMTTTAWSGHSGNLIVADLPFTSVNTFSRRAAIDLHGLNNIVENDVIYGLVANNVDYILFQYERTGTTPNQLDANTDVSGSPRVFLSGWYFTNQ